MTSHITAATFEDLIPPQSTVRWIARRKAQIVIAVRNGLLTETDACARYGISHDELASWMRLFSEHGLNGLRAKKIQQYRRAA